MEHRGRGTHHEHPHSTTDTPRRLHEKEGPSSRSHTRRRWSRCRPGSPARSSLASAYTRRLHTPSRPHALEGGGRRRQAARESAPTQLGSKELGHSRSTCTTITPRKLHEREVPSSRSHNRQSWSRGRPGSFARSGLTCASMRRRHTPSHPQAREVGGHRRQAAREPASIQLGSKGSTTTPPRMEKGQNEEKSGRYRKPISRFRKRKESSEMGQASTCGYRPDSSRRSSTRRPGRPAHFTPPGSPPHSHHVLRTSHLTPDPSHTIMWKGRADAGYGD